MVAIDFNSSSYDYEAKLEELGLNSGSPHAWFDLPDDKFDIAIGHLDKLIDKFESDIRVSIDDLRHAVKLHAVVTHDRHMKRYAERDAEEEVRPDDA